MSDRIEKEIIEVLEKNFYVSPGTLKGDTNLEEVIADSMDFVELVAVLTTKYKISINSLNVRKVRTIRDVADLIEKSRSKDAGALASF